MPTFYITKYALTTGIEAVEGEPIGQILKVAAGKSMWDETRYFESGEWHRTLNAARKCAETMKTNRIASLEQSLAKLREIKFKEPA